MPRIDPVQLLNCLSVLLSPNGGIRSNEEVHRLVSLMTKFSKKLVSKCIYIQILKCTETELLGSFMGLGGWRLVHMWLTESIVAKNWPLVRELLELLLLCPVDIERLKTNNCPKLVKELSKDGSQAAIRALAAKLVEQWLKTVKGEPVMPVAESDFPVIISEAIGSEPETSVCNGSSLESNHIVGNMIHTQSSKASEEIGARLVEDEKHPLKNELVAAEETGTSSETVPPLKISLKDVKPTVSDINEGKETKEIIKTIESLENPKLVKSKSTHSKHSSSSKSHSSSKSRDKYRSSSSSSKSSGSSGSKDKHKDSSRHSSSNDKHKDRKSSSSDKSSKSSSRDKSSKSSSSDKSSSKSKSDKSVSEKSFPSDKIKEEKDSKSSKDHKSVSSRDTNDKNKDNIEKAHSSMQKFMKIPKISEAPKKEAPSISIESRKPNDPNRPKTVKTFNSKFRSHGLEEEAKPPPSRSTVLKKASSVVPPAVAIPKRQSPTHSSDQPPEKKPKVIEPAEKPGSIKLIPAKPKPALLLESDMFMDALNASATNKKEPKKRKRRTSGSKDGAPGTEASPPTTPTSAASATSPNREAKSSPNREAKSSPNRETKSTPFRFYKDTLEEEDKEKEPPSQPDDMEQQPEADEPAEENDSHVRTNADGLRGVLCYHKRKGPKKSIRWRPDAELEQIQYFELDETERVNVSKTFSDMKNMERIHEREAVQKARNLLNDDVMEVKTSWRGLIPLDCGEAIDVEYGKNSKEQEIQAARQKNVLQSIYLKMMVPDSPCEPDLESHPPSEPTIIPLDDVTGNPDTVSDFRGTPWPEPKGSCPSGGALGVSAVPHMFPPMSQFPGPFPNGQFPVPGYQSTAGAAMVPPNGDWTNGLPPNVMVPGAMPPVAMPPGPIGPMPPGMMMNPNMPPGMMMPPDGMMGAEMFGAPPGQNMFPMPDGFNMGGPPPGMFRPGFPVGPPGPVPEAAGAFPTYGGRGGMRGRGSSGQWRGGWDGAGRGRGNQGGWKKAKCIHFMKKGSCRQGDSCAFMHPGVNCPY